MRVEGNDKTLTTHLSLPPGPPAPQLVREFLRLALEEYRWFKPVRYGFVIFEKCRPDTTPGFQLLLDFYERKRVLTVLDKRDDSFFMLFPATRPEDHQHAGALTWVTPVKQAEKPTWQRAYREQVATVMRLFKSPLATAALSANHQDKTRRLIPVEGGQLDTHTVRDYSEGLPGLFWHNFYGSPFLRLFGERLDTLPPESLHRLGPDLVVVQPYALPTEADSESAQERERHFIQRLGPECFYDFEHHRKPTRLPSLEEAGGQRPDK